MKKLILIPIALFIIFSGCTHDSLIALDDDLIVVRAYIYANEPISDIQVTGTIPLGSEATELPPINDADVVLIKEGQRYSLVPSEGDSGYYHYDGDDLVVETGDKYEIEVKYQNQLATGTTYVPEAPEGVTISKSTLKFPDLDDLPGYGEQGVNADSIRKSMSLTVNWQQVTDALYYIVMENIEENPTPVDTSLEGGYKGFISSPVRSDEFEVNAMMMTHYGDHVVKVYRVNQEYADLYESRDQDSRDLNEPLTNINGGLGIFSAFNSNDVYFELLE